MTSRANQEFFNFLYLNDAPDVDTVLPWKWSVTRNKILYNIKNNIQASLLVLYLIIRKW